MVDILKEIVGQRIVLRKPEATIENAQEQFNLIKNNIKTFIIRTDVENNASERVAQKLGYKLAETLKKIKWRTFFNEYRDLNIWKKELDK